MLLLTNNVGDPQKLIDMKFSIYSYIKMKYFALKIGIFRIISVFETTAMLKIANLQYFSLAPFARSIGSLMRL